MRRRLTLLAVTAAAAAAGIAAATPALASVSAPAAPAARAAPAALSDTTVSVSYPVTGSTFIKAINSTIGLGPGTLATTADLTTSTLTGTLTLPPATGSFKELGLIPVTATTEMIQDGTATGTVNFTTNAVTTTATDTMKLTSLKVAGLPIPVGPSCETSPATITVSSQAGFSVLNGGTLSGTYTIPTFAHCGLATLLINLTLPGPGNTISLTLGKGTLGS
ncbi:MAG TPA: hypothetical protein VMC83_25130 [Streptosporangiaceae bacterium]|nr:hypothetical protein [Streptosporangiaceae bacterium]